MYSNTTLGPQGQHTATRSQRLRAALAYAAKGKPVFPVVPGDKKPVIPGCPEAKAKNLSGEELAEHARNCSRDGHGLYDATTDPRRIHAWWSRWPDANIGMPAGERSGVFVLDVDQLEALKEMPEELPETLTVQTPREGRHLYFQHVEGVRNSPGGLPKGIDVRGEGGYVLLPPSTTANGAYVVEHRAEIAEAPEWLLELVRERSRGRGEGNPWRQRVEVPDGVPIPEGTRNDTLKWKCYWWHQDGLADEDVEARALAYNEALCKPALSKAEVIKTARSMCRYPIRKRKESSPEAREVMENAWRGFYAEVLPKSGHSKTRDSFRSLLEFGERHGDFIEAIVDGEIRRAVAVSLSSRQGAIPAATSNVTFWKSMNRLEAEGKVLAQSRASGKKLGDEEPETWLILEPATRVNTPGMAADARVVNLCRAPEETPAFRYRHPVGNARGGTLVAVEMYPSSAAEELARIMGYSRVRDFKRKHLDVLVERGDIVEANGRYDTPENYAERMEAERHTLYSGWKRTRTTVDRGRMTRWVEHGPEMSDVERDQRDLDRYAEDCGKFREVLKRRRQGPVPDSSNSLEDMLPVARNLFPPEDGYILGQEWTASPEDVISSEAEVFDLARAWFAAEEVA